MIEAKQNRKQQIYNTTKLTLNSISFSGTSDNDKRLNPVGIYMLKVNNGNTRIRCEICSELTIKTPERRQWRQNGYRTAS